MNTILCDAETSELADMLAPFILDWVTKKCGWKDVFYMDRGIHLDDDTTVWCLSELVPIWAAHELPGYLSEFHEDCRWQPE